MSGLVRTVDAAGVQLRHFLVSCFWRLCIYYLFPPLSCCVLVSGFSVI